MSEIPEDIAVVSSEVLTKIFGGSDDVTHEDWQIVARAILAERERCAKRVYDSVDEVPWLNRTELSEAIRNPKT